MQLSAKVPGFNTHSTQSNSLLNHVLFSAEYFNNKANMLCPAPPLGDQCFPPKLQDVLLKITYKNKNAGTYTLDLIQKAEKRC